MDSELYPLWKELFAEQVWPGDRVAIHAMAEEIRGLRLLADTIVTAELEQPLIQSREPIQRARDVLAGIINDAEVFNLVIQHGEQPWVRAAHEVLCWTLRSDDYNQFARHFELIEQRCVMLREFAGKNCIEKEVAN
jgi:hypothetical protein